MAKQKFITPVGEVKFPSVGKPNKKGKYDISLVFDPKDSEFVEMEKKIREAEKDFEKKYRDKPHYKKNYDIVDGEKAETDKVIMRFNSAFPLFDEESTKIFDAKGNPVKTDIGWGSKCRVSFTLCPYEADGNLGVTRYISGIQVIDLKLSDLTAESCGFKEEEGYVYTPVAKEEKEISEVEKAWDSDL